MYCYMCVSKARPVCLVKLNGYNMLFCSKCILQYETAKILLSFDEFNNDQYLTEIVCRNEYIY